MRSLLSYLTAIMILAMLAAAGGAWLPVPSMVSLDIPSGVTPFPHSEDIEELTAEFQVEEPGGCFVPLASANCSASDFRSVPVMRPDELLVPAAVNSIEDWRPLVERYFVEDDVDRALQIIFCESGGDPAASNPTSSAQGLFQHLGSAWPKRAADAGWSGHDVLDPVANIAVAAWLVYDGGGWSHWAASGHCW